jgi:glycosyltransferase involved in cell wall biosynthesis
VLLDERVEVVRLGSPTSFGLPPEINYIRLQPRVADETLALARRQDPAFLYQRLAVASYAGPMIARELRVPYVLEYNGSEVWIARNWGRPLRYDAFAAAAETASLRHAHLVVTVSGVLRDELVEHGVEPERIVMHPNGVDPQTFDPAAFEPSELATLRDRLGLPRDAFVVGFIGTFGEWHGADVLARAIRRLAEHNRAWLDRRPVRFLLVGDGFRMPEVRAILGDLVGDVAVLPGLVPQREAPAHLAATDLLVSPHVPNRDDTRFFGSPTKLFEYMAIARPIVASDLEQLGEVLRPALHVPALPTGEPAPNAPEVAVLARPGDVDELVAGIRFLVENPAWAARLGANARARVLGHYTWRHHVAAILERLAQRPS